VEQPKRKQRQVSFGFIPQANSTTSVVASRGEKFSNVISTKFKNGYEESDDCNVSNNDSQVIIRAANIDDTIRVPGRISNLGTFKAMKGLPFK
jgi:hypothetical protein